jgi:hypothetical protein
MTHNPYFFHLTPDWEIHYLDNTLHSDILNEDYNVKISRKYLSVNDISISLECDDMVTPLVKPKECLEKHFRWFYTYYSYKVNYTSLSDKIRIPIDNYLSKAEQDIWLRGNASVYWAKNGMELQNILDSIEVQFFLWWKHNTYEEFIHFIGQVAEQDVVNNNLPKLADCKDSVFNLYFKYQRGKDNMEMDPVDVCQALDSYTKTNRFMLFYKEHEEEITQLSEEKTKSWHDLNAIQIEYYMVMPGKIQSTNAGWNKADTVIWKVDALRLLSDDYVLTVESRTTNNWAFAITFVLALIGALACVWRLKRRQTFPTAA